MLVSEADLSRSVVVDIGGHTGVDLMNVLQAHPDLPSGALVLQDRPEVIAKVAVDERIEVMVRDMCFVLWIQTIFDRISNDPDSLFPLILLRGWKILI